MIFQAAQLNANQAHIMGILNVTPDSFSDGGLHFETGLALKHAQDLIKAGAHSIDVGGESTRPGAARVPVAEELRRVIPVVSELSEAGIVVSVDTTRAQVAREAIKAGAQIINDVSGGLGDPEMAQVIASEPNVSYVVMHWRGHATVMDTLNNYSNLGRDVATELSLRLEELFTAGVSPTQIVLDPGLGFSKLGPQNWHLLAQLKHLRDLGYPILIGASRKRFLTKENDTLGERDLATAVLSGLLAQQGFLAHRVHNVAATARSLEIVKALEEQ